MRDQLEAHLGITATGALSVVLASFVLFVAVTVVLRWWGQRLVASASTFSVAFVTLVGAVAARATLGDSPTLAGGLVALSTLLVLERSFGRWSSLVPGTKPQRARPAVLLMIGDKVRDDELRRYRMTRPQLWSQLRQHGIAHRSEIGAVILEPDGTVSVVRTGTTLDRQLMAGVRGIDEVPDSFFDERT